MNTALLIMVHGSPTAGANDDVERVGDLVRQRGVFDPVVVGYLECNEPSISDAIDRCVAQGAVSLVAVPYFLHTGTHVAGDLPDLLEEAAKRHPDVEFKMGRYLGASPVIAEILAERALAAVDGAGR